MTEQGYLFHWQTPGPMIKKTKTEQLLKNKTVLQCLSTNKVYTYITVYSFVFILMHTVVRGASLYK